MKRFLKIAVLVLVFVIFSVVGAACGNDDTSTPTDDLPSDKSTQSVCEHKYDNACDKDCNICGKTRVTEHVVKKVNGNAPTCTEAGLTDGEICSVCEYIIKEQQVMKATGHDEVRRDGKAATCTEGGYKDYVTCSRCDYTTYEATETLGHSEIKHDGKAATCTDSGYKPYVTCGRCDYTTYEITEAFGHNEARIEGKAPTCTEAGLSDGIICDVCQQVLAEQTALEPTGHIYDSSADRTCNACGEERGLPTVEKFNDIMQNIFSGDRMISETVMFIDYGQSKKLLYTPDRIISVKSYDMKTTYEEGRDYLLEDGYLVIPEGSRIPCITSKVYYGGPAAGNPDFFYLSKDGKLVSSYWGENDAMTKWQVNVEYTHSDEWDGFRQQTMNGQYASFISKLERGEDVTIFFYGDSITVGANASGYFGTAPNQHPYTLLAVDSIARLYGYSVQKLGSRRPEPIEGMNHGDNGTITYINTAVGGWKSADGVANYEASVDAYIKKYGCDLFVVAFGMNDGSVAVSDTVEKIKTMIDKTTALADDCAYLIISTMVPNPDAYNAAGNKWLGNQINQEDALVVLAEQYRHSGISCAVARMTSVSLSILEHKDFVDYTGNNINHPNDFFSRVYAQTVIQTLIGYENISVTD